MEIAQNVLLILAQADTGNPVTEIASRFGIQGPMLFAQIINFGIVAGLLYFFAIKPVLATIDERQGQIKAGLDYAEEMKRKLAEAEEKQQEMIREASREGKRLVEEARHAAREYLEKQTQEANEKASSMISRAEESIEMERRKMLAEVRGEISRLVVSTSIRVLGRQLSDEERSRFLNAAAEDLQKN